MRVGKTTQIVEARNHLVLQPLVDHILAPEIAHAILDPLKIRDRYTTCVCQNVGYDKNPLAVQNFVRGSRSWSIRAFSKNLALDFVRVLRSDLVLSRSRDQHITFEFEQLLVAHMLDSLIPLQ